MTLDCMDGEGAHGICLFLAFFKESEPISQYLHTEVDPELRQRIAKMGMDMLLKMVRIWVVLN